MFSPSSETSVEVPHEAWRGTAYRYQPVPGTLGQVVPVLPPKGGRGTGYRPTADTGTGEVSRDDPGSVRVARARRRARLGVQPMIETGE
jgi:hypothetical protein